MRKWLLPLFLLMQVTTIAQLKVQNLLVENRVNPAGIDAATPRFSWQLISDKRNVLQTAYELRVAGDAASLAKGANDQWSSGKVASDSSIYVSYKGAMLIAGKFYYWQVRVWDNQGNASAWSEPASFQMGLLTPADWKAKWIEIGFAEPAHRPSPLFRKEFNTAKKIKSATAFITAHGLYEACINGKRVGDGYLTPGWTSYNKRLQYQVYDVTNLLAQGNNAIGVMLGNGWYRGNLAWGGQKDVYGKDLALLLQLEINYTDGSTATIISDGSWKSSTGEVVNSEIYHGETIDARKAKKGWCLAGYNDAAWSGVNVKEHNKSILIATENEPVKKHETFKPKQIVTTPKGETVIDFGQNLVGWVVVKAKGNAGDSIVIYHAEVLDKYGNFYIDNLRAAKARGVYILKGDGEETFEPRFTFYGFRYIKIEGYTGEIKPENFTAVALYSDMPPAGTFTSSNLLLNQLQHNIQWGQNGNFLDVPTDCPQRDERLGWTGDAQAFSLTAAFNRNVRNFFSKWLKDVEADQRPNGSVPFVIPDVLGPNDNGSAGWADVATIIPWNMYQAYGDGKILQQQYNSMKAWVDYMSKNSTNDLWNKGFHFGDWLFYRPFDDNDGRSAVTDKYLIAQCFYAHSTQLLINAANVLGKTADAANYSALLQKIKDAFVKEYVTSTGRLVSSTQTAYVLALNFDMLPESQRTHAAQRLVDNIKSYNYHLTTGFLGTPYLCHVLSRYGHDSVSYKLLMQETYPSWLYPVKMGATTIWERWDGIKPDSTFQTPGMNSFNHYAYGAIGDWMYRNITGLNEQSPGYKNIIIKPKPGGGLHHAAATLQTPYGKLSSGWKTGDGGSLVLDVEVPANTTATIYIPAANADAITEGGKKLSAQKDLQAGSVENGFVAVKAGSGKYQFVVGAQPSKAFHSWAPGPPMGWNSWDCFGPTVTEDEVKANADYMAKNLKQYGWEYIVVDIRWYVSNDKAHGYNEKDPQYNIDEYGRLIPAVNRFPSAANGKGFKTLADYLHGKGLKFGIHIMRGIPVIAVNQGLPVKGSTATAKDIYSDKDQCLWLRDMYTIVPGKNGSQEYYNSLFEMYASWGVDFVKVDDLSSPIYFKEEIEMIRNAIDRSGRKMVLSTSPGETPIGHAAHVNQHANMWRTVGDFWDNWAQLKEHFEVFERWNKWRSYGAYPDGDMLPMGRIGIRAERGNPRMSRFTKDEQYTLMTLWAMFKSPLMFGGNLPANDEFTLSLLTNKDVLNVLNKSVNNRPLFTSGNKVAWVADEPETGAKYLAVFNKADNSVSANIQVDLTELGFTSTGIIKDLWTGAAEAINFRDEFAPGVNGHGARLFKITPKQ